MYIHVLLQVLSEELPTTRKVKQLNLMVCDKSLSSMSTGAGFVARLMSQDISVLICYLFAKGAVRKEATTFLYTYDLKSIELFFYS